MDKKQIKVIYKEPDQPAEIREIEKELSSYQKLVKGYIEIVPLGFLGDIALILNEEGKIYNMRPNIYCQEYNDIFVGPVVFVKDDDNGDMESLDDDDIAVILEYIKNNAY